jgi:hypothetical protein
VGVYFVFAAVCFAILFPKNFKNTTFIISPFYFVANNKDKRHRRDLSNARTKASQWSSMTDKISGRVIGAIIYTIAPIFQETSRRTQ